MRPGGFFWILPVNLLMVSSSWAYVLPFPKNLAHEILSESVPTAFAPNSWTVEDFSVDWVGNPIPGVQFSLGKKSLQWVRVSEVLALPRAHLEVRAEKIEGGRVTASEFSDAFRMDPSTGGSHGTIDFPVALISGDENLIQILIRKDGKEIEGRLRIRFKPRDNESHIYYDPSCSRFGLTAESIGAKPDEWVYFGCRLIYSEGGKYRTGSLEVLVFWDNVGNTIQVGGLNTPQASPSLWTFRLRSHSEPLQLKAGNHQMNVRYFVAERLHLLSLGMGIGPYSYLFQGQSDPDDRVAPIITLYASFFLTETVRIVAFDATAIAAKTYTDLGLYLNTENFRIIDRRLTINLLLGAHVIAVKSQGQTFVIPGFPQGLEMSFSDFLMRGKSVGVGGFIYPSINGKAYHNVWIRWGGRLFAEINYIYWEEVLHDQQFHSRSLGVSFGFPLGGFF